MTIFEKIIKYFTDDVQEELILPDSMVFNSLNAQEISNRLDIKTKAVSSGKLNLPESDSTSLDVAEEEIQTEVMKIVRGNLQNYDTHQLAYRARISSLDPLGLSSKCKGEASLQINNLRSKIKQESGGLYTVKQSLVEIEEDWQKFKTQWNIKSDPNFGLSKSWKFGILFLMVLAETIINGSLIGPYIEGGLIEGWGLAIIFPILTLLLCAYPAGNLIRRLFVPAKLQVKALYVIIVSVLVVIATIMNLFLAYIRESVGREMEWSEGLNLLITTLSGNPIPIQAQGVLLFLLSVSFFIAALIDVFFMDHPVPGLLERLYQRNEKHREYSERLKNSHKELLNLQSNSVEDYKKIYNELSVWQIEHNNLQEHQIALWSKLQAYINHVENTANKLLKSYREVNKANRTTPPPDYFKDTWVFPLSDYRAHINISFKDNYSEKIKIALNEITKSEIELNSEFQEISNVLTGIDALLMHVKG